MEVLTIHEDPIERYGGVPGVRDGGLPEAALYRPQTGYFKDLMEEDAAPWESSAPNHPFVDGNRRVGFAVTSTFLAFSGVNITADAQETLSSIDELHRSHSISFASLVVWPHANTNNSSIITE